MAVTKTQISTLFPRAERVKQIGSKQLFIVYYPSYALLISYKTVIGYKGHGSLDTKWNITLHKYSKTTCKQITQFHRIADYETIMVDDDSIQDFLKDKQL